MTLSDPVAAKGAFADYTNNVLRVEQVEADETANLPANLPFRLFAASRDEDRRAAKAAVETVVTNMPAHVRKFYSDYRVLAPTVQWLLRRCKPGVTNETDYLQPKTHPVVWREEDFDLDSLSQAAGMLSSNSIPMLVRLSPIYEEYEISPIKRAQPLVDYPDPRPEAMCETPFGMAIVLRAPENRRKFRFRATAWPVQDRNVSFRWVQLTPGRKASVSRVQGQFAMSPENGYAEFVFNWTDVRRRMDFAVFARYGDGPYGPPSTISFFVPPNEARQYNRQGYVERIDYRKAGFAIPSLYQNKPWADAYTLDEQGRILGFVRTRTGSNHEEKFDAHGDFIVEAYSDGLPKTASKVRYFTRPDDSSALDYEVTTERVEYRQGGFELRTRGEFPTVKGQHRKAGLK